MVCNQVISLVRAHTFIVLDPASAEASGNTFQIRPHREFLASKGRNRLLSLRFLAELSEDSDVISEVSSDPSTRTDVRNAYDFMQRRNQVRGDPNAKRWNAAIRLANFASLESAPLCVRYTSMWHPQGMTKSAALLDRCFD